MSEWTDHFENHKVHSVLKEWDVLLTELESSESSDASEIESVNRLRQVHNLAKSTLASVDPNLVSQERLNTLSEFVELQVRDLNLYKTSDNVSYLKNHSSVDQILNQLANIPTPRLPQDIEGLREALTTLRRSMGQHARLLETDYESIENEFKSIKKSFSELTDEIKSQKARLDTAISQFQQQFSDAESKRREEYAQEAKITRDELKSTVESGRQDIASVITNLREEFDTAEEKRQEKYSAEYEKTRVSLKEVLDTGKATLSTLTQEHKDTFANAIAEVKESRKTMEAEFANSVQEYMDQLEIRKGEAEKLVQVIGNTGMVGGYQKVANQERLSSWIWHGVTLVFMIGLVVFAIIAFQSTIQGDFKLGTFGARAFVAIAFGIGVAWAARQAEKYQEVERRSRKMELELASINPYLALLPENEQVAVKIELAKRFFGQTDPIREKKGDKEVTGSALDLVRMALEMLAKK